MKTYIDVQIASKYEDQYDFILAMKDFGDRAIGWEFLDTQSEEYASLTGESSCVLLKVGNKHSPAVAITVKENNIFYITNIVPKENGEMSMAEYNDVAKQFAVDVVKFAKTHKLKIEIKTTRECIGLSEIISGDKTRELFERYLNLFPGSYHPLDIERLDKFICATSRYSRRKVRLDLLRDWLIAEKKWSEEDASRCVSRIETGLSILKVNRRF
jgi:hypothetical protein